MSEEVTRFKPTNGRAVGVLGLLLCAVLVVVFAVTTPAHVAVPSVLGCAFAGVLFWVAMLRPRVSASGDELRMLTMFHDLRIPLAAIDSVVVRRYLLITAGGRKFICPAISRPLRTTVRKEMNWTGGMQMLSPSRKLDEFEGSLRTKKDVAGGSDLDYPDLVEQQIASLADNDRARRGIEARSEEEYELGSQVERNTAWIEIGLMVVLAVAFVVALVVG